MQKTPTIVLRALLAPLPILLLLIDVSDAAGSSSRSSSSNCYYDENDHYTCNGVTFGITRRTGAIIGASIGGVAALISIFACWFFAFRKPRSRSNDDQEKNPRPRPRPNLQDRVSSYSRRSSGFAQIPDSPLNHTLPLYDNEAEDRRRSGGDRTEATTESLNALPTSPTTLKTRSPRTDGQSSRTSLGFGNHFVNSSEGSHSSRRNSPDPPSPAVTAHFPPTPVYTPKIERSVSPVSDPNVGIISQSTAHPSSWVSPIPPPPATIPHVVVTSASRQNTGKSSIETDEILPPYQPQVPRFPFPSSPSDPRPRFG
ncbi:hypothetical protein FRC02_005693 [Tulasnella sp. 418]|nr:hypothetical protein FRC02_005693 [Tulasnella sp. 418]